MAHGVSQKYNSLAKVRILPGFFRKTGWKCSSITNKNQYTYNGVESKRLLVNAF